MNLRIPAGVKIDGQGVGGRFVSLDMLPVLADATDDTGRVLLLDLAARELDRATEQQDRLERKFQDDPRAFAVQRENAEALREFWESFVDETSGALVGEEPAPDFIDRVSVGASEVVDEDVAYEWEVGLDYESRGGASSNVDVNFRVSRNDGKQFGFSEAQTMMTQLRANISRGAPNPVPAGYRLAGIDWRNPHRTSRWTSWATSWDDLGDLQNVLYIASDDDNAWRIGSVE